MASRYRDLSRSSIVEIETSPIANMIGMFATKGSPAIAPAAREDPPAAFRVATVELHKMAASLADVVRMRIDGRATPTAIRGIRRQSIGGDEARDRH